MEVIIAEDKKELDKLATIIIVEDINRKKDHFVLGTATGGTPEGVYDLLCQMHEKGSLDLDGITISADFSNVVTFALDEYIGLEPNHPQSYRYFMNEKLYNTISKGKKGIKMGNTHVPNGMATDIAGYCKRYEEMIKEVYGIDLQILGIGPNGHIGFNEPGSALGSRTRIKRLTNATIKANSRYFEKEEDVPKYAITMGMGTIQDARKTLLLANGPKKARVIQQAVEGPITASVPAAVLQQHQYAVFIVDREAGRYLAFEREEEGLYKPAKLVLEQIKQLGSYEATRNIPAGFKP